MRRRLLIAAVFLLAGAVVNVAVAWGIAGASTNYDVALWQIFEHRETKRPVETFTCFGCELVHRGPSSDRASAYDAFVRALSPVYKRIEETVTPSRGDWSRLRRPESFPRVMLEEACGWPRLALRWYLLSPVRNPELHGGFELGGTRQYSLRGGGSFTSPWVGDRTIPLIPIWTGFAINTTFYAAVLWLLVPGPFALRRFVRRRRGLCPACAYDLRHGEHDACPECGRLPSAR